MPGNGHSREACPTRAEDGRAKGKGNPVAYIAWMRGAGNIGKTSVGIGLTFEDVWKEVEHSLRYGRWETRHSSVTVIITHGERQRVVREFELKLGKGE